MDSDLRFEVGWETIESTIGIYFLTTHPPYLSPKRPTLPLGGSIRSQSGFPEGRDGRPDPPDRLMSSPLAAKSRTHGDEQLGEAPGGYPSRLSRHPLPLYLARGSWSPCKPPAYRHNLDTTDTSPRSFCSTRPQSRRGEIHLPGSFLHLFTGIAGITLISERI